MIETKSIIKICVPSCVEPIKAVVLNRIESREGNITKYNYILYAQKRLFKASNMVIEEHYIDEETGKPVEDTTESELSYDGIIVDYCIIPEYDTEV